MIYSDHILRIIYFDIRYKLYFNNVSCQSCLRSATSPLVNQETAQHMT